MIGKLLSLFGRRKPDSTPQARQKIFFDASPEVIYAVGDVHGCYDLLKQLEAQIKADAARFSGPKWIVMLGDYVDRGPKSASVIDHLLLPAGDGFTRYCLAGNHEEAMLDFLAAPSTRHPWLGFGGDETLRSYGISRLPSKRSEAAMLLESYIPDDHIAFLKRLPSLISVPGHCFLHACMEPHVPIAEQTDQTLLWMRPYDGMGAPPASVGRVVHGHTPVKQVEIGEWRINADTGAYMSGRLSAVRLTPDGNIAILSTV